MLCPHCGHHGQIEQIEFSSDYEIYYCSVCGQKYIAYFTALGDIGELVPISNNNHWQHEAIHPDTD